MKIISTGTCFDDAIEAFTLVMAVDQSALAYGQIVHGICEPPEAEGPFSHAWFEHKGDAIFIMKNEDGERGVYMATVEEYHKAFFVTQFRRYSLAEAYRLEHEIGTPGPWDEPYTLHTAEGIAEVTGVLVA